MSTTQAKIIKIGNSYGVRLPKEYMKRYNITPGSYISLPAPKTPDYKKALAALEELSKINGALGKIKDPSAWQREIRKDRPLPGRD